MENKFYKIGEISKLLGLPASTLRYWETEFNQLRPTKSSGRQRFYTQKHIDLLQKLKTLLYDEKLTIDGVKQRLKNGASDITVPTKITSNIDFQVTIIKKELLEILSMLK